MRYIKWFNIFVVFAVLGLGVQTPCQAVSRVFLLGGQSNMGGGGFVADLSPPYDTTQTDVNYWSGSSWVSLAPGFGWDATRLGPEVSFGRAIADAYPDDDLYLVSPVLKIPRGDIMSFAHVLKPLADLAPGFVHPVCRKTIAEIWQEHPAFSESLNKIEL